MIFGIGTDIVDVLRIEKMESLDIFAKKNIVRIRVNFIRVF